MQAIIRYWPVIATLAAALVAYGEMRLAVAQNTEARETDQQEAVDAGRMDERQKAMEKALDRIDGQIIRLEDMQRTLIEKLPGG